MLCTRIGIKPFGILDGVTFALFGYLENAIGLVKLFHIKKQLIRLSYYSQARQKYEIKKLEEKTQKQAIQFE